MSVKRKKLVSGKNKCYGIIGSPAMDTGYKVGDLVLYQSLSGSQHCGVAVVCYSSETGYNHPFLMGWACNDMRNNKDYEIIKTIVPAEHLTKEILYANHRNDFKITEEDVPVLTLDEVKGYVPFEFELAQ